MSRCTILATALLATLANARAEWTVADLDPVALARIEVPQPTAPDQPAFLEISCLRGTSENAYTLRAEMRLPRIASGLPSEATRQRFRLGRECRGPITNPAAAASGGEIVVLVGRERVATRASIGADFLLGNAPAETRRDGACEIVDRAVDSDSARLLVDGQGETATRYIVELLAAEHAGEMVLEAPGKMARQAFPIAGAAAALARIRRLCGWWEPFGPAME